MEQAAIYFIGEYAGGIGIWFSFAVPRANAPEEPVILYDGGDHAVLYRRPGEVVALDYVPKEWRARLYKAASVKVAEGKKAEVEYDVKVEQVLKIPSVDAKIVCVAKRD